MYNKRYGKKNPFAIGNLDSNTLCGAANLGLMAHPGGNAHRAGGVGSDAVADAGFIAYGSDWLGMSTRRNQLLLLDEEEHGEGGLSISLAAMFDAINRYYFGFIVNVVQHTICANS